MKRIIFTFVLVLVMATPLFASAHGSPGDSSLEPGVVMMKQLEDQALGNVLHEEMENLMTRMISGDLTQAESARMLDLMNTYPGPGAMMMGRMMSESTMSPRNYTNQPGYETMMGVGLNGGIGMALFWVLIVAVAVILTMYGLGTFRARGTYKNEDAREILRSRYAKGEIDTEEFETRKKGLE